jgi:hypothetical protein
MNTQQNIIERLQDAANIMHEHAQYNDEESEHNGEGLAAETCEDAADIITELLSALERLTEKVARANAIQHIGTDIEPEDWSELYSLTNEARAAIAKAKGEIK